MTSAPPHTVAGDPRDIITPDAFQVDPGLLGIPLARPWRRGAAMAVDGVLLAILSNAPSFLLAVAAALVLFRATTKPGAGGFVRKSARFVFRFSAAAILFVAVISASRAIGGWFGGEDEPEPTVNVAPGGGVAITGLSAVGAADDIIDFRTADDEAEARAAAEELVEELREVGTEDGDVREVLLELAQDDERPWLLAAANAVLAESIPVPFPAAAGAAPDSLVAAYASALAAADTARAGELRRELTLVLAADTLREVEEELREERGERMAMDRRLDAAEEELENVGVVAFARSLLDDLGLGFGWAGLYFTASLALWRGRTPGKRLLRLRVIRLDGKPIGWWAAFGRFGGYAAGVATGLLGFLQIYWDRNRQAVHDKISETVVVRE